jgi:protein-S-isoprenylcysteine O-methyltransferase Ste14
VADHPDIRGGVRARAAQIVVLLLVEATILFGAAGRLDWVWAWVFLGIYLASVLINAAFLMRTNPETVAERGRPGEFRRWDRVVSGLWALAQFAVIPLVAGLDARFAWTGPIDTAWHLAGAAVFAAGLAIFGWAMVTNAYFSTAARIQTERGQTVCRNGPYRVVRHPGYAGTMLQSVGIAVLFGSCWALVPAITAILLIVVRTRFEDRMLQDELPGYPEFARVVHHRLVPGIW